MTSIMGKAVVAFFLCILTYHFLNTATQNIAEDEIVKPKERKFVKLTMKQGLLMNQVLANYGLSNITNAECKNHMNEFKNGLRAFEPWALKMFDSSSKLPAGILLGNIVEYGSFDLCLGIKEYTVSGLIQGKLCTVRITPSTKLLQKITSFNNISERRFEKAKRNVLEGVKMLWSVCVPNSCRASDILPHYDKTIRDILEGLEFTISLTDDDCVSPTDKIHLSSVEYFILFVYSFIILLVIFCSVIDYCFSIQNNWFIDIFSGYSNGKRVFDVSRKPNELDCLHGIRFLSTCHVVFGHRYMGSMIYPNANSFYLLQWVLNYFSTLVIGGTVCVDTFFFISAFLVSYNFFQLVTKHERFNVMHFYLYRYVRVTLPYTAAITFNAIVIRLLGSGPLWHGTMIGLSLPCQLFWWSALLHVQSYVNPSEVCIAQTWYLTVEMFMFYMSPLIMYPLWKWPKIGYINYIFLYILSIISSFYVAWYYQFEASMPLTANLMDVKYMHKHYFPPHTRASSYIIGLGFGYFYFKYKNKKIKMREPLVAIGWIAAITLLLVPVLTAHIFQMEEHDYNRLEASMFLSCTRSAWTFGIMWLLWACINGYGGIVNSVLSAAAFKVLGRVGYGIFLCHATIQQLILGAGRTPSYFSDFIMLHTFFGDMGIMVVFGFFFTIFFESPTIRILSKLFSAKITPQQNGTGKKIMVLEH